MEARQIQVAGVQGGEKEAKGLGREALEEERGKVQLSEKEKETSRLGRLNLEEQKRLVRKGSFWRKLKRSRRAPP